MPPRVDWITASAGTGKTTALVKNFLNLLKIHKPEQIVCITFTTHAAEEMKTRIAHTLPENVQKRLRIQTIHSLCYELIHNHHDLTISILTPPEKVLLLRQVFRKAIDESSSLVTKLSKNFSIYYLQSIVERIFENAFLLKDFSHQASLQNEDFLSSPELSQAELKRKQFILEQLAHHPLSENLQHDYESIFLTKSGEIRKKILDAKTAKQNPELALKMSNEAEQLYQKKQVEHLQQWLHINDLVREFIKLIWNHYMALKGNRVDYDELLIIARNFLENDINRYEYTKNIYHVLLDESQDTNSLQWNVIEQLTQHLFDDPSLEKSFFVVGDEKQAIYGFQNASPEFLSYQKQKYKNFSGANFFNTELTNNYRSSREICRYVEKNTFVQSIQCMQNFEGKVIETTDFQSTFENLISAPPYLHSVERKLEHRDILILCRKRNATYFDLIEQFEDKISYEKNILLQDLPELKLLMFSALLKSDPQNQYATYWMSQNGYKVENEICSSDSSPIQLAIRILDHNEKLLNLMLEFIADFNITDTWELYNWLAHYPLTIKVSTGKENESMKLMTIHGAKGLQSPVVIYFDKWSPHFQQDIWWNYETGEFVLPPSKKITHPTIEKIKQQNQKKQDAEDKRLKYVALTRAMEILIVVK